MTVNLRKIIIRGICTFGATIDRDGYGYGRIGAADPSAPCLEPCDYCGHMADYILRGIENAENRQQQSTESTN